MINDAIATAGFVRHCLWNSRENWNTSVLCNNRFNLTKCDTWAIRLYEITSSMGGYFDYCWGFIGTCQLPWFWWFCGTRWRSQRSRGDEVLFATGTFVWVLNANVASAVCTRHSRDALWWCKSHSDLRLPMFLELLKLRCRILKGLEGSQTGSKTLHLGFSLWIDLWWEPLKEGLSLNTSYLIQYLLTVDLRLETCFTIDSWLKTWDLLYYWQLT